MQKLDTITSKFQGKKILVVGDMIADVYLHGNISKVSREAPVLVLEETNRRIVAGGAANVVANLSALGAEVYAVGVVGDDFHGEELKNLLKNGNVHIEGLVTDKTRPTIAKTRVVAGGRTTVSQQVVRIDREYKEPLSKKMEAALIAKLDKILPNVEGIVLSDYCNNAITHDIRRLVLNHAGKRRVPCIVDSLNKIGEFRGATYAKQNDVELSDFIGKPIEDMTSLINAGSELLKHLNANALLITRGELGLSLFERGGSVHHIPVAERSEVYDISGAGNTVIATFLLAIVAGFNAVISARLANYAAGITVKKFGTSAVNAGELTEILKRVPLI